MQTGKAIGAGIVGALAMTGVMLVARLLGMQVNLELMLGSMLLGTTGFGAWLAGLVIHLALGAVFAIFYAGIFERGTHRASAGIGAAIGIVHALITGAILGAIPSIHPLIPEVLAAPGAYLSALGTLGVIAYFALHAMYGAIVGRIYAPVRLVNQRLAHQH